MASATSRSFAAWTCLAAGEAGCGRGAGSARRASGSRRRSGVQCHGASLTSRARLVGGRGGGGGRARGPEGVRRDRVVTRAAEGDGGDGSYPGEEEGRETAGESQRLANEELAKLRSLPLADDAAGENVVGVGGVPQAIVEAERKSKPLRRYRLGAYALASSAAAAQMVAAIDNGITQWPTWVDDAPLTILTDIFVIITGSLLWRMELANRAEALKMIWQKARSREKSLSRAEAGLGDTLWTSRMRKKTDQQGQ